MTHQRFIKQAAYGGLFFLFFGLLADLVHAEKIHSGDMGHRAETPWPPKGNRAAFWAARDTWVSSVEEERNGGNGGAKRLKVKGQQEYSLLDFDLSTLKGKNIVGALLHVRSASVRKAPLKRLGVSTVAGGWEEGTASRYRPQSGSASFNAAQHQKKAWSYPGSTLMNVVFGRGHTRWKFADCSLPDEDGWQSCAVEPKVIAADAAGLSHGFCLYDEVGSEWSYQGGKFAYTYFPNRFVYSRESKSSTPWIEVWTDGTDSIPPEPISSVSVETSELRSGEAILVWRTPADRGGGRTLGFHASYQKQGREFPFPRYLIPMAQKHGEPVRMHIKDMPFKSGEKIDVAIRPIDEAGNIGAAFRTTIRLSSGAEMPPMPELKGTAADPFHPATGIGGVKVAVVDPLIRIDPLDDAGSRAGKQRGEASDWGPLSGKREIHLYSAKNETVAFLLVMTGEAGNIRVEYDYEGHPGLKGKLYQFGYVKSDRMKGGADIFLPDPLLPIKGALSIPSTAGETTIPNQKSHALICELYVPHQASPGKKKGVLRITDGEDRLTIDVHLTVWNFTLPNQLSFIPEMNAYETVSPYNGYAYYRLAHEHRTCINRLPYNWVGRPAFAPTWDGNSFGWEEWDLKVGPLLDGSAFADMPRNGEPVDVFYLPVTENWPVDLFDHYRPSYWVEEAFHSPYPEKLKKAFHNFARHCNIKGWHDTIFQFYLNNKVYYRQKFRLSSAPWIFDEPVNTQDFWALRWYGRLWKEAVSKAMGDAKMWFRGDISYSQFSRNMLWGIMDIEYIGGNDAQKTRMKHDEWTLQGKSHFAEYGSPNKIGESNLQPVLWCLSAWAKGAMGVLPWQTIGSKNSWHTAEQTALFYPHPDGPCASVRLKAFTAGQQLVEYLTLFGKTFDVPRYQMADWLQEQLKIGGMVEKQSEHDAGTARFGEVTPKDISKMRMCLGEMLDKAAPPYQRSLVDWKTPEWDPERLPDIGYVSPAPHVKSVKPDCDDFRPR